MSFETGGDIQDPFEDDTNESETDTTDETADASTGTEPTVDDTTADERSSDDNEGANHMESQSEMGQPDTTISAQSTEQDGEPRYVKELDVTESVSTTQLARALMQPTYHEEDPPVPYAVWREGTSTGRSRTTIELNSDVDELVKQALREFNSQYDADIHKADIRELTLAYGLVHLEEVFEMAEEWGIQFNS